MHNIKTITGLRLPFLKRDPFKSELKASCMMTASIKRILRKIRSEKIQNKIETGKIVYFLNPLEEIAFKYVPGKSGKPGKYYAKYYGQNEFEIDYDSSSILMAVMEGKQISKARYDNYHLIEGVSWNRSIKTPATYNAVGT